MMHPLNAAVDIAYGGRHTFSVRSEEETVYPTNNRVQSLVLITLYT